MSARLLIIDHQLHRLEFLEAVLLKAGYAVAVTTSGTDALAACASQAPYDLILLDMQFPAGESLDTYQALRAQPQTRALPILLLTAAPMGYWQRLAFEEAPPVVVSGDLREHAVVVQRVQWMLQEAERAKGASGRGQAGSGELLGRKDADLAEAVVAPVE